VVRLTWSIAWIQLLPLILQQGVGDSYNPCQQQGTWFMMFHGGVKA